MYRASSSFFSGKSEVLRPFLLTSILTRMRPWGRGMSQTVSSQRLPTRRATFVVDVSVAQAANRVVVEIALRVRRRDQGGTAVQRFLALAKNFDGAFFDVPKARHCHFESAFRVGRRSSDESSPLRFATNLPQRRLQPRGALFVI